MKLCRRTAAKQVENAENAIQGLVKDGRGKQRGRWAFYPFYTKFAKPKKTYCNFKRACYNQGGKGKEVKREKEDKTYEDPEY